ncbi:MAG: hypothetical protein LQ350_002690 [Teloschistes chrysophthalmus]|nr:MAG: hypothetical protein LQ350_002690 [Niorma chrysophthalma]
MLSLRNLSSVLGTSAELSLPCLKFQTASIAHNGLHKHSLTKHFLTKHSLTNHLDPSDIGKRLTQQQSSILPNLSYYNVTDHRMKNEKLWPLQTTIWTHTKALADLNGKLKEFGQRLTPADREVEVMMATVEVLADKTEAWMSEVYEFGMNLEGQRD